MGIYLYTLRKPIIHVRYGYEVMRAAVLKFARKPYFGCDRTDRVSKGIQTRAVNSFLDNIPEFAILEEIKEGAEVLRWKGKAWSYDTPGFDGYAVGNLHILGKGRNKDYVVEIADVANIPFRMVEEGMNFTFSKENVARFNAITIEHPWVPLMYRKGVTAYTERDVFTLQHGGVLRVGEIFAPYSYRCMDMPEWFWRCYVKVFLRARDDLTNEFEAMYS